MEMYFSLVFRAERSVLHIFEDGLVGVLSDSDNVGILIFLVVLGVMVSMMNKAGGSAAFGEWAGEHIKDKDRCPACSYNAWSTHIYR